MNKSELNIMTLKEMEEWVRSAKYFDTVFSEFDECGNHENESIFEKDGKFYSVTYLNGKLCERFDVNKGKYGGWVRGEYRPIEVTRTVKQVMVEQVEYIPMKEKHE